MLPCRVKSIKSRLASADIEQLHDIYKELETQMGKKMEAAEALKKMKQVATSGYINYVDWATNTPSTSSGSIFTNGKWTSPATSCTQIIPVDVTSLPGGHSHSLANSDTQEEKKEPQMAYDHYNGMRAGMVANAAAVIQTEPSEESKQRDRLSRAVRTAYFEIERKLRKSFNMDSDSAPSTLKELFARIKEGKFKYQVDCHSKERDDAYPGYIYDWPIDWVDPSKVKDTDGYDAAYKRLTERYTEVDLDIAILPIADALALVKTFKTWTA